MRPQRNIDHYFLNSVIFNEGRDRKDYVTQKCQIQPNSNLLYCLRVLNLIDILIYLFNSLSQKKKRVRRSFVRLIAQFVFAKFFLLVKQSGDCLHQLHLKTIFHYCALHFAFNSTHKNAVVSENSFKCRKFQKSALCSLFSVASPSLRLRLLRLLYVHFKAHGRRRIANNCRHCLHRNRKVIGTPTSGSTFEHVTAAVTSHHLFQCQLTSDHESHQR